MFMTTQLTEIRSPGSCSLPQFLSANRQHIDEQLLRCGAVYFSGFPVRTIADFAAVRDSFVASRARYVEGATPRSALGEDVFTSTDYPASQVIALHSENSYARTWPRYLLFAACRRPPAEARRRLRMHAPY
jgi:Taurine catabolism dioxygenase TauD, TfdA family